MDSTIENLLTTLRKYRSELCRQHIDSQLEQLYKSKTTTATTRQTNPSSNTTFSTPTTKITAPATISTTSSSSSSHPTTTTTATNNTKTTKNNKLNSELETIDCFLSNIKHLEKYDSEATEDTSSDDSYDELEDFSHQDIPPKRRVYLHQHHHSHLTPSSASTSSSKLTSHQQPQQPTQLAPQQPGTSSTALYNTLMPNNPHDYANLKNRAIWTWANERSRLACRWTWLQAQVADLEFRIRGQNDATIHARAYKVPPLPPMLPENSCSRTVALNKDFRRRRLIKSSQILSDSNRKLVKYSHIPCICSSLPQTVAPCLSCNGRYNYLKQIDGENLPISERISLLDPCCHPVLSFPDDLTLGFQLSYLLKQETINRKPTKGKPGRKKGSTAANLAAAAAAAAAAGGDDNNGRRGKYYTGLVGRPPGKQSQSMITSNKLKRKYRKHSNTNNYNSNNWAINSTGNNPSSRNNIRRNKRIRSASSMNDGSMYSGNSNHLHPHHTRPSYCSTNNNSSAQNVTRRRRSEQSAYDIDNIVIPFSIAATTRVEVLEYKEIVTPSWRVWENGTSTNHNENENANNEDVEDTSDEAYMSRHSKGESEEKKRFSLKPVHIT